MSNGHQTGGNSVAPVYPENVTSLWSVNLVKDYLTLLDQSSNPETLEASAGAIQNLAACYWQVDLC